MPVVLEVVVILHAAEEGQDVGVTPLVVAPFGPTVVVLGDSTVENLAVNGGGAAGGLAPGDDEVGLLGGDTGAVGPTVGSVSGEKDVVAELQVIGQMVEIGVVGAGLQEQDGLVGVLGQAGGDGSAGGASTHHDVVVTHRSLRWLTGRDGGNTSRRPEGGQGGGRLRAMG